MFKKLLLLFIAVPIVELMLFMTLSDVISLPVTLAIIVLTGILGASLAKQQGMLALSNLQKALASGQLPHNEATDGILILLAGAVLLTPGFLTDAVGFALLIEPVREEIRGHLATLLKKHIKVASPFNQGPQDTQSPDGMKKARGRVIED